VSLLVRFLCGMPPLSPNCVLISIIPTVKSRWWGMFISKTGRCFKGSNDINKWEIFSSATVGTHDGKAHPYSVPECKFARKCIKIESISAISLPFSTFSAGVNLYRPRAWVLAEAQGHAPVTCTFPHARCALWKEVMLFWKSGATALIRRWVKTLTMTAPARNAQKLY